MDYKEKILTAFDQIADLNRKIQLWQNCIGEEATGCPVGSTVKIESSPNQQPFVGTVLSYEYRCTDGTIWFNFQFADLETIRRYYPITRIISD